MDNMDSNGGSKEKQAEHQDLLAIVERMRSIPGYKPALAFRMRVAIFSRFPDAWASWIESRTDARAGVESRGKWRPSLPRAAAFAATAAALVILLFAGLSIAARDSNPGDPLYFVKRARESIELTFTWDKAEKVEKYINLANTRLKELDSLISAKLLDSEHLVATTGDYVSTTRAIDQMLQDDGELDGAGSIAARLATVKTAERNIAERLAAAAPSGSLALADGAAVTVSDNSGKSALGPSRPSVSGKTDGYGEYEFDLDLEVPEVARAIDVTVEQDGRREVVPLYGAAKAPAKGVGLAASVEPAGGALTLGQPRSFSLTLSGSSSEKVANIPVRLSDSTGTSLIDGRTGDVTVYTDARGRCTFNVTKTSVDRASRIEAVVVNGTPRELGEVLVVGGVQAPGAGARQGVTADVTGPPEQPSQIILDNGIVTVRVGNRPGRILESVSAHGVPGSLGPIDDPLAAPTPNGAPIAADYTGPFMVFSEAGGAGYEVICEAAVNGATLKKIYEVTLLQDQPFATIECRLELIGGSASLSGDAGPLLGISSIALPPGAGLQVSGVACDYGKLDKPTLLGFSVGAPYSTIDLADATATVACPIDSQVYPRGWIASAGSLGLEAPVWMAQPGGGRSLTLMLGITGKGKSQEIIKLARQGIGSREVSTGSSVGDGFEVTVEPSIERLEAGRQRIKLVVRKQYEALLDSSL